MSKKGKSINLYAGASIVGAVLFLFFVGFSVLAEKIPPIIFPLYFVASILSFIMYAIDKSAAKKGAWRVQENTLHLISLAGGWPGAIIAQQELRHKTQKQSFRAVFWVTAIINSAGLYWVFTPNGSATIQLYLDKIA